MKTLPRPACVAGHPPHSQLVEGTHSPLLAVACLESGIAYSNKEVRNSLLPWAGFLQDPRLARVAAEVQKELGRRANEGMDAEGLEEDAGPSPDLNGLLAELLPITWGKRTLFIGGVPREIKRRQLERILELEELVWPDSRGVDSAFDDMDSRVRHSEILLPGPLPR